MMNDLVALLSSIRRFGSIVQRSRSHFEVDLECLIKRTQFYISENIMTLYYPLPVIELKLIELSSATSTLVAVVIAPFEKKNI